MANPDYAILLAQIAAESDPAAKAILQAQAYVFTEELTQEEIQLFEFVEFDYIENNPGYVEGQTPGLYVIADYVIDGYINTNNQAIPSPYVLADYVLDGYINIENVDVGPNASGWSAYAGQYYNDNGEVT